MNLKDIKQAYFLGIGGIGMSAIARYFNTQGIRVAGYDRTETTLTKELCAEGIDVHYDDRGAGVAGFDLDKNNCLVVLTPAVPKDHGEWAWLRDNGFTIMKRSQVLGIITDAYITIGVAGTHGKTTTSTLVAHILKSSRVDCAAFLGGISSNYHTNLLLNKKDTPVSEQYMVVEADEFDRSFLTLHPSIGIITSTDADHLDIYGEHDALKKSFLDYAFQTKDVLFIKKGLDIEETVKQPVSEHKQVKTYSVKEQADVYASNIRIEKDRYFFNLHWEEQVIEDLYLGIPGMHNVENAVAASAAALTAGVSTDELRKALASFNGVKRRFEYIVKNEKHIYIDDYAHHPEELKAIIGSVKQMYAAEKVVAIFQPHLYSRTRDFAEGFAQSLSMPDELIMLDIYPARELPIPGVTSQMILDQVSIADKHLLSKEETLKWVTEHRPKILLTLGAGDIDQLVEPIGKILGTQAL